MTHLNLDCINRKLLKLRIDTVIKLYTHTISRNNRKTLNIQLTRSLALVTMLKRNI